MVDDIAENQYNSFIINRGLSYFPDTVFFANEINLNSHLPARLEYDFLINTIKKKKRFSKWHKKHNDSNVETIKQYYGYSNAKAEQVIGLFNAPALAEMKRILSHGGRTK
jgi:hypothetical protein